jgi:radical SAM superfamily enzyme YgiQ (UPF0313 family)
MNSENRRYFEMGPIRPPNEGKDRSLLLRVTRNCPWNRCLFCSVYKRDRFEYRPVAEIKADIAVVAALAERVRKGGSGEAIVREVIGEGGSERERLLAGESVTNVANWLAFGARTVFLQDADTLIMRTPELVEVIRHLKAVFPTLERFSCYARAKTCLRKTPAELSELVRAGLSRLHLGLESGNDAVLAFMQKGVTREEQIAAGKRVVATGVGLSQYVMPGLGGRRWSEAHARDSASALSEIGPEFVRLRSLVVFRSTPLAEKRASDEFEELPEDGVIDEIGLLIENLKCRTYLASDQANNLLPEIEGRLPQDREQMLGVIKDYRKQSLPERLEFRLRRRLRAYQAIYGRGGEALEQKVAEALECLRAESPEAEGRTNEVIWALKQGFV